MKFQPRAAVEQHHHIQELIERQEKRSADRESDRNKKKELAERDDLIADSKLMTVTDFWCDKCRKDFKAQGVKQVEEDWTANQRIAYYKSKCFKGHFCIRYITDKNKDPFYFKSKLARLDQGNHTQDTLQPFQTNYNLVYGRSN